MRRTNRGAGLYGVLHSMGVFGADPPSTLRAFATQGQLSPQQMLDRYGIECAPVRQTAQRVPPRTRPSLDHTTLRGLALTLGRLFWRDLEIHHPGICSLNLAADVGRAGNNGSVKTSRAADPGGQVVETRHLRSNGRAELGQVRAFYLDIAQWAMEDPARWGPWAAPSPVRREDLARGKEDPQAQVPDGPAHPRTPPRPARADSPRHRPGPSQRRTTRRPPQAVAPGEQFTCRGEVLHRAPVRSGPTARTWSEDPATGARRDLSGEEDRAFWTWAAIETLRHTGIRIEELSELSHHSLVQYTPPTSNELIPLLQIAPSKTDTERLLVISPELADVLAAVIHRIREPSGAVAAVASYDPHERVWNPPMPLLFQRRFGGGNRAIPSGTIRDWICQAALDAAPALDRRRGRRCGLPRTTSDGSSSPTPSCTACHPTSPSSSPATATSTPPWATRPSIPRKPSTATARSSPAAGPCAPPRNTARPPTTNGRSSSATSSTARSRSAPADAPTPPPASTSTPACVAHCSDPTPPNATGSSTSATT